MKNLLFFIIILLFACTSTHNLTGTIKGLPSHCCISIEDYYGEPEHQLTDGSFTFTGLYPGEYYLSVHADSVAYCSNAVLNVTVTARHHNKNINLIYTP